jgi:alcohol dehydrogenase (NADP+)
MLNTGTRIPALGFGTWQDEDAQKDAVLAALKTGYRHIDTARIYGTEKAVGAAIKASGVPHDKIFLTTKLWNTDHHPDNVEKALDASIKDLQVDYVDLFLMHWPVAWKHGDGMFPKDGNKPSTEDVDYLDTWKAMEKLFHSGKAKAIGICNFSKTETERILKEGEVIPAVHQLECHPWLQQNDFTKWLKGQGIHVTQYSPFGNANEIYDDAEAPHKLMDDPVLVKIGAKYGKSGSQVALAWGIFHTHSVIPKSKTMDRIKDNFEGDFRLDKNDILEIENMDRKLRFNDSSTEFGYQFFTDLDGKK